MSFRQNNRNKESKLHQSELFTNLSLGTTNEMGIKKYTDLLPNEDVLLAKEGVEEDLWVSSTLRAGSIIGARHSLIMPDPVFHVVLALAIDPNTLEYSGLFTMQLGARFRQSQNDESRAFFLDQSHVDAGLYEPFAEIPTANIAIDKMHFIPMSQRHFEFYGLRASGQLHDELFAKLVERFADNELDIKCLNIQNYDGSHPLVLGTNKYDLHQKVGDFLPTVSTPFADKDFYDTYSLSYAMRLRKAISGRVVRDSVRDYHDLIREQNRQQQWLASQRKGAARFYEQDSKAYRREQLQAMRAQAGEMAQEIKEELKQEPNIHYSQRDHYEYILNLIDEANSTKTLQEKFDDVQINKHALSLPSFMWPGRYISVNIPDINDESNRGNAHRPMVVTKIWEDKDSGDIKAVEGYVSTRNEYAQDQSNYHLRVNPLFTKSQRPGFLILDTLVRLPFNQQWVNNDDTGFFELSNDKFKKLEAKVNAQKSRGLEPKIFGIREVSENWQEREMTARPSSQWFDKQVKRGDMKLDDNQMMRKFQKRQDYAASKKGRVVPKDTFEPEL